MSASSCPSVRSWTHPRLPSAQRAAARAQAGCAQPGQREDGEDAAAETVHPLWLGLATSPPFSTCSWVREQLGGSEPRPTAAVTTCQQPRLRGAEQERCRHAWGPTGTWLWLVQLRGAQGGTVWWAGAPVPHREAGLIPWQPWGPQRLRGSCSLPWAGSTPQRCLCLCLILAAAAAGTGAGGHRTCRWLGTGTSCMGGCARRRDTLPHVGSHTPREGTGSDFPLAISKFHRSYRKAPGQNSCNAVIHPARLEAMTSCLQ